jgi:glycosyltransferase involved in cell wall biosynthesis
MKHRRVMHVVVGGDIGGAERLLVDLATRPSKTGALHQVALLTPNPSLARYFDAAGLAVHDRGRVRENPLAYLMRSLGPRDVAWLAGLMVRERIDIVHTHTFGSHVLGTRAARRAGRPQVRTEHHVMHYFDPSCSPFTRWAAARTDRFVAVSRYVAQVLARTAPEVAARTAVIHNGVDPAYWSPRVRPATGPFSACVVSRLTGWKRVHLVVEAAARARVELVVVGDGEERRRLEALARRIAAPVRFVGYQADPRPWLAACDIVVSASSDEPLGLSLLEALSMERPVVAYSGGGVPEIVEHGLTGWLVGEASADAFARALDTARRERQELPSMGARARRFVIEQIDIDRMCQGYADIYDALASSS